LRDPVEDARQVVQHLVVGHAEDTQASPGEHAITFRIVLDLLLVNGTVDFDDQTERMAVEVDDEAVDDLLTPKWKPCRQ
jgi:hypothetical protein